MADVRSMLRAERASRRITHPHASYRDGKLLCNLCELPVKSEAQWQSHLHSTQHNLRSQQRGQATPGSKTTAPDATAETTKKRKADELESAPIDERKKARAESTDAPAVDRAQSLEKVVETNKQQDVVADAVPSASVDAVSPSGATSDMDAELAAFEREIAALDQPQPSTGASAARSVLDSQAFISAAPMTAEQIAAQAREDLNAQRGKREVEIEAGREDAARVLEDEFEEMHTFEERVRILREKREAVRATLPDSLGPSQPVANLEDTEPQDDSADDDSDYDEDEWKFGAG